jgi:hypothetical protein
LKITIFLLFLFATSAAYTEGYSLKKCEWANSRVTGVYVNNPRCMPDTLYHWLPRKYLDWKLDNIKSDDFLPFYKDQKGKVSPLFTWRTPVGSFGYGDVSIRIKLKDGIKYTPIFGKKRFQCEELKQKYGYDIENTVFVSWQRHVFFRVGGFLSEYILCSAGPVESWSFGTEKHLFEIEDEIRWIESHDKSDYDSFISNTIPWEQYVDGYIFSRNKLDENITNHKNIKNGKIFYRSRFVDEVHETIHYQTSKPIFFNKD